MSRFFRKRNDGLADYKRRLRDNVELVSRSIILSKSLRFRLLGITFLEEKLPGISRQPTRDDEITELLTVLCQVPEIEVQSVFSQFLVALRRDGQEHVANILNPVSEARPMSNEHYVLLKTKANQLCTYMDPLYGLLDELVNVGVFSESEKRRVTSYDGYETMSRETIDILSRKSDSAFDCFIDALRLTNQEHVASLLGYQTKEMPMSQEHRQLLMCKTAELMEFIHPSLYFLSRLVSVNVLSKKEMDIVINKTTYSEMSLELVTIILRKSDRSFGKFIDVLNDTEQQHVVYILTGQGESPLSRVRRLVLRRARSTLIGRVDTLHTSLLSKLISNGVLNNEDRERIESCHVNEERAAILIDVIARKSQVAYDKFTQAFRDSGHIQVAETLEGLELRGIIDPHFLKDTPIAEKNTIVQRIRSRMEALVSGTGHDIDEITRLMELNGFAISAVSESVNDISLRCFSEESLEYLNDSKSRDKLFTQTFCRPYADQGLESLEVNIKDDDIEKCGETFDQLTMTDERRQTLLRVAETACKMIAFTPELLNKLSLKRRHKKAVLKAGKNEQVMTLFDIVSRQPDRVFTQLISALRDTRQDQAADYILNYREIDELPVELIELVLMSSFIALFVDHYQSYYKRLEAARVAYSSLAAVSYNWRQTMNGWPQSTTRHWFKHKLRRIVELFCNRLTTTQPTLLKSISTDLPVAAVTCVAASNGIVTIYIAYSDSDMIDVVDHPHLKFTVDGLKSAVDMISCRYFGGLFIADSGKQCIWSIVPGRANVQNIKLEAPPLSISTSRSLKSDELDILLVTTMSNVLRTFDCNMKSLNEINLPRNVRPLHAVQTYDETFVVCHSAGVSEFDKNGSFLKRFDSDPSYFLRPCHLVLDPSRGRIFVADLYRNRISLLTSELQLANDFILDQRSHNVTTPNRLCYDVESGQLVVGEWQNKTVQVFTLHTVEQQRPMTHHCRSCNRMQGRLVIFK